MSSRQPHDKRRYPRRAKSIRFRFEHDGDLHFGVTTGVSLAGAFVKASHVPGKGAVLVLEERFNPDGVTIALRGEVVWTLDAPTLERPDTGFGFRFSEAFTRADPGLLEDFLRALDPAFRAANGGEIAYEERATGVHAVFRFPTSAGPTTPEDHVGPHEPDEPHVVDLARELERLSREEARSRGTTGPTDRDAPPPRPRTAAEAPAPRQLETPGLAKDAPPAPPPEARARTRKRSVTGIFTALFGRSSRDEVPIGPEPTPARPLPAQPAAPPLPPPPLAPTAPISQPTARPRVAPAGPVDDRPQLVVSWSGKSVLSRVESLSKKAATIVTEGDCPAPGDTLALRPLGGAEALGELAIHGVVRAREERASDAPQRVFVDVKRVEEPARSGRFQDLVRLVKAATSGR